MYLPVLQRSAVERLLVFRALHLGDMLCAVPALRALRAALPSAHITLVGLPWAEQFAARYWRYIDAFVPFPGHPSLPEQPADARALAAFLSAMAAQDVTLALQLHGSGEVSNGIVAAMHARVTVGFCAAGKTAPARVHAVPYPLDGPEPLRLLQLITALGMRSQGSYLEFPLLQRDWDELRNSGLASGLFAGRYACIHPGARDREKCWPVRCFAELADFLAIEYGLTIVLTGSEGERDLTGAVASCMKTPALDTAGPISIGAMAALMSGARVLVCNDTGVSHIAAGLGLPSVVIFSKADMKRWAPVNTARHRCLWDPAGEQVHAVREHVHALLAARA